MLCLCLLFGFGRVLTRNRSGLGWHDTTAWLLSRYGSSTSTFSICSHCRLLCCCSWRGFATLCSRHTTCFSGSIRPARAPCSCSWSALRSTAASSRTLISFSSVPPLSPSYVSVFPSHSRVCVCVCSWCVHPHAEYGSLTRVSHFPARILPLLHAIKTQSVLCWSFVFGFSTTPLICFVVCSW